MRLNIFFSIYKSDCEYISVIKENIVKLYMYTFDSPAHVLISFWNFDIIVSKIKDWPLIGQQSPSETPA